MSITVPLTSEEIIAPENTVNALQDDSSFHEKKLSSKQRLYLSLMKPGRISYWLAIDSSFIKAIIHYFSFIVLPVLIGVSFSLLSYEISIQYKQYGKFLKSGWLTILFPIWVLIGIPSAIVLYRFIHSLIHYRSFPRHVIHVQWGRLLYIIGLIISFTFYYLIQTKDFMINPVFTLLPLCISCFLSIPLLSSRIHGLNQFVRKWHQQLQDEHHSRLLIWKANMLKAQVIGEMILYSTITLLSISFYEISFHIPLRFLFIFFSLSIAISLIQFLILTFPILLFLFLLLLFIIFTFPILFSYMPPFRKYWKKQYGEVDLSTTGRFYEGFARFLLFLLMEGIVLLLVCCEIAIWEGLGIQNYDKTSQLLNVMMITSIVVAVLMFILLVIRLEIGVTTTDEVFNQIADREVGNRDWSDMITHLPEYVLQTEEDVYMKLPETISQSTELIEIPRFDREEELCLICMSELANTVLLPCGHGGCCQKCAKVLYKQTSKRTCPLCRQIIQEVAKMKSFSTKMYNHHYLYSIDKNNYCFC